MSLCQCLECGLILAKKLKVGLRVSRLLVSGSLGPTVVGHGGEGGLLLHKVRTWVEDRQITHCKLGTVFFIVKLHDRIDRN